MQIASFFKKSFSRNHFVRNILILMSGTVIAQAITVIVSPILTRLFSPSVFGVFGIYMSVVSIVTAIVTLRYDQALMLPKDNKDAAHLFWAAIFSVTVVSTISFIFGIIFFKKIIALLKIDEAGTWILLFPLSVFLSGIYLTFTSWFARQKKFKKDSVSQVVRSAVANGTQVSFGMLKSAPVGLIAGNIFGDLFSSLTLVFQMNRDDRELLKKGLHYSSIKHLCKEYSDFPLYSSTQNFLNAISQNVPVLLLAKFFGPVVVGYYALGVRVLQLPMNFILTSLRQVLFQRASEVHNANGNTYSLFKKTTLGLFSLALVPTLIIIAFGPTLFGLVLGKDWVQAGVYARWLVIWLAVGFINPPAMLFAQIYRKQKLLFFQDLALLIFRIIALVIGGLYFNALGAIIIYSMVGLTFNSFVILYMWFFIRGGQVEKRVK
jgi:lipopolysaccharide exporter